MLALILAMLRLNVLTFAVDALEYWRGNTQWAETFDDALDAIYKPAEAGLFGWHEFKEELRCEMREELRRSKAMSRDAL